MWTQCCHLAFARHRRSLTPWPTPRNGAYENGVSSISSTTWMISSSPALPTPVCAEALATLDQTCSQLGVPIADHKRDGPTTCLTYLGIEVDTVASQLRLPQEKLHRLQALLAEWGDRKVCGRRELEALIGTLNHACKVVRSGRSFLRRILDLLHAVSSHPTRPHPILLNRDFRSDLMWWHTFVASWNGVSFLHPPPYLPCLHMTSDASGSWG